MVVGNGLLAKNFSDFKNNNRFVIFASGVSNSNENRLIEFRKEKKLLLETIGNFPEKTLIYFSTCAFYDNYISPSPYLNHKNEIEKLIKKNLTKYYIFRVPQIIGSTNQNQLLGFLNSRVFNEIKFDLLDIERNLIDLKFLKGVVNLILKNNLYENEVTNISYPYNISVRKLVTIFERIHKKKAIYKIKKKDGSLLIDSKKLFGLYEKLELIYPDYYEERIKYYYE
jgi:hypothetical protein